jgi:hypothetical protein
VTALDENREASQDAAIKALGKRFVRSFDEPNPEDYRIQLHALGFLDDVGIGFMLCGWAILRQEREQPPAAAAAKQPDEPATDRQLAVMRELAEKAGVVIPERPFTKDRASEAISQLKAGTFDPDKWEVPF